MGQREASPVAMKSDASLSSISTRSLTLPGCSCMLRKRVGGGEVRVWIIKCGEMGVNDPSCSRDAAVKTDGKINVQ